MAQKLRSSPDIDDLQRECMQFLDGIADFGEKLLPVDMDAAGQRLLLAVIDNFEALPATWARSILVQFVQKGVSWTCNDLPLEKLLQAPRIQGRSKIVDDVVFAIAQRGVENPLFAIARSSPAHLHNYLDKPQSHFRDCVVKWMSGRDDNGCIPVHYLWHDESLLAVHSGQSKVETDEQSQDAMAKLWVGTLRVCWDIQQKAVDIGVSMETGDFMGRTVLDACIDRIEKEDALLFPGRDICVMVRAEMQHRHLSDAAPDVVRSPRQNRL